MRGLVFFLLVFSCFLSGLEANARQSNQGKKYDFVVAADGSGDFKTVQAAIDAVPHFRKNRTTIFIKNGTYKEKLMLASSKNNVTFIGESVEGTIITYDDYASRKNKFGEELGTTGSSGFFIYGEGFIAKNITFSNTAGQVGQAVAVRVDGDQAQFINCRFLGNQDTLYTHGKKSRQYYKDCYIEGTVDFIFGWSTAVFENCEIYCKRSGYITAASTSQELEYGYVFFNCKITGKAEEQSVFLGRPWRPYAKVVFVECDMGAHIRPEGWHNWGKVSNQETAFYAEYKTTGPGAYPDSRVEWAHILTPGEAADYTLENIFGDWMPSEAGK